MNIIEYFKLQAKNLHKDFKTQTPYVDPSLGDDLFAYTPKFFDVDAIITDFDIDEQEFTLMNAQHIIAKLAGFESWAAMRAASPSGMELGKLLFNNMHKIRPEEWEFYLRDIEIENDLELDDEEKLDIFKTVYAGVDGHQTNGYDYRLLRIDDLPEEDQLPPPKKTQKKAGPKISALPLTAATLKKAIETANWKFEDLISTMEPDHPESMRKLWNPEKYIVEVIKPDMLPIDRDYALSLIEAFLIHHFIDLDNGADEASDKED